ncbi:MAG: DUF1559 domain-containing protein [Capsulimonadaceae bacterium]|nr:DUF1559 domain-containing protein [Capsulimonadaceae bacterium]
MIVVTDRSQVRAFTLIELLVSIAIIAILAAVLFPIFAQAREKARSAACLSNLKQLGLAYTQYEQDYDEIVPCGTNNWGGGNGWAAQVFPYAKSTSVFLCPDDINPQDFISYAINSNMVPYVLDNSNNGIPVPVAISEMASPARSVMLFEVINCIGSSTINVTSLAADVQKSPCGNGIVSLGGYSLNGNNSGSASTETASSLKYATGQLANAQANESDNIVTNITGNNSYFIGADGRHQSGANYLLADGHARWFKPTLVGAGYDTTIGNTKAFAQCPPTFNSLAPSTDCNLNSNSNPVQYGATFALREKTN